MQLKCSFCSTPFALSNDQVAEAIGILKKDPHGHYDAHCPKCRRANKLPRKMFAMHPAYRRMLESNEPAAEAAAEPAKETGKKNAEAEEAGKEPAKKEAAKKQPAGK